MAILDCCFSGQAIEALSGNDDSGLADLAHVEGVYTLTATTRNRTAHVPPPNQQDSTCTSFTGELSDLVHAGIPNKPPPLTFGDLYPALRHRLREKGLPTPNQRGTDTAHQFPFSANAALQHNSETYTESGGSHTAAPASTGQIASPVGLEPERAAEVITTGDSGGDRRGSGYLVTDGLVLTAAHLLTDTVRIRVRFNADQPNEWSADGESAWTDPNLDIALIRLLVSSVSPLRGVPEVTPVCFGRIERAVVPCHALGFPRFKLRNYPDRLAPDAARRGAIWHRRQWSRYPLIQLLTRQPGRLLLMLFHARPHSYCLLRRVLRSSDTNGTLNWGAAAPGRQGTRSNAKGRKRCAV